MEQKQAALRCNHYRIADDSEMKSWDWQVVAASSSGILLASPANHPTFFLSTTERKEGDPMSNEISDLVKGMEVVMKARQPSL